MENQELIKLPTIALRGLVAFPNNALTFDVGREKSKNAIIKAIEKGQRLYLVGQKDFDSEDPTAENLYSVGVVAELSQTMKIKDGNIRVIANGLYRAKTVEIVNAKNHFEAVVTPYPEKAVRLKDRTEADAVIRTIGTLIAEYNEASPGLPKEVMMKIMTSDDIKFLSEYIPSHLFLRFDDKQRVLEENNALTRLCMLCEILDREINVLDLENEILDKVRTNLDKNQKDYMLREQMQVIARELGNDDNPLEEGARFEAAVKALGLTETSEKKLLDEVKKFSKMPPASHEASVLRSYIEYVLSLPFGKKSKDKTDTLAAERVLNRDHYGLTKVKERILETIAVKHLKGSKDSTIICLVGPPGVGKTSIAKSIASALGRKYVRVSLGGVHDEAEIRGHRKTYIGSMPGRIISAIKTAGSMNPLILLDEIDKLSSDHKGDPASALLEVLDSEQNHSFNDNYLEIPFDLSDCMFITTANDMSAIPRPLLDRLEIIEIDGYTRDEKLNIARRHLVKKAMAETGLKKEQFSITPAAINAIIDNYTREAGVRELFRVLVSIMRKSAKAICANPEEKVTVTKDDLTALLGPEKYLSDEVFGKDEAGIAQGLAWTSVGGEVLPVEVLILKGSGKTVLTGSLGDVFKESCQAAVSYIRSISELLGIDENFYKENDIHIHAPEGAVPKDGPSAGVTIITAMISALTGTPVRNDIAMTGEITLKGKVLAIGGLSAKAMAAHRLGVKTVLIPEKNRKDLIKVDERVREDINFVFCKNVEDVINAAFLYPPYKKKEKEMLPTLKNEGEKSAFLAQ